MSTFDFSGLSPDTILDGIESLDILVDSGLLALNSYENRVYQFHDDNNIKYVTKFYRPERWLDEQILEEHQFTLELSDNEIPVVAPLVIDGQSLFSYQGYRFALYPCRGGRIFEVDNLDQLEWMGRFLGRIHSVGSRCDFSYRPSINTDEFVDNAIDTIDKSGYVPQHLYQAFFTVLNQVAELTKQHFQPIKTIRLHGDCHAGNILWTDSGPHFVDLDDCRQGPAVQDIWMMLSGDRQQKILQLDTLLSGYEEFCEFDPKELTLIESLRSMRQINYMSWLCKRWQDPAFPVNFPWFSSDKYWEEQILALKEQYAAIQEPPLSLGM